MKLAYYCTPYTKINSKWIKDLNIRLKIIDPLEKNICSTLFNIGLSNIFLDMSPEVKETKAKINKNYIKLKNCTAKETISKTKKNNLLNGRRYLQIIYAIMEKEMATHSSILAWRIPWMEEPGGLQSMGSQKVRHD